MALKHLQRKCSLSSKSSVKRLSASFSTGHWKPGTAHRRAQILPRGDRHPSSCPSLTKKECPSLAPAHFKCPAGSSRDPREGSWDFRSAAQTSRWGGGWERHPGARGHTGTVCLEDTLPNVETAGARVGETLLILILDHSILSEKMRSVSFKNDWESLATFSRVTLLLRRSSYYFPEEHILHGGDGRTERVKGNRFWMWLLKNACIRQRKPCFPNPFLL